jgi:bzd-type benzoyl-CoA reductase N subunit
MEGLTEFHRAAQQPGEYLRDLKSKSGKKVIGYFCSYTPEEIIHAAGAHPARLFGGDTDINLADAHLQSYCCSLVRSGLEEALQGNLSYLDGTVFPHTCDSIQRLSDIWRLNTSFDFFADVVLPVKLDTPAAKEYMADVLEKFRRDIGNGLGVEITDQDLSRSIRTYNRIRLALRNLYDLRAGNPDIMGSRDLYAVVKAAMIMDRDWLADRLEALVNEAEAGRYYHDSAGKKRLLLVGGVCDHPDIYDILEKAGGTVIYDDLCTGSRYFNVSVGEDGAPIKALADRYLRRPVCPAKHQSTTARGELAVQLAKEQKADGVIILLLKFCDPHAFDYPYIKDFLDKAKVPNMLYEIEDQLPSEGQLATRFETFIQML